VGEHALEQALRWQPTAPSTELSYADCGPDNCLIAAQLETTDAPFRQFSGFL
jgi:hypothetical protein